jgi:hypothetical protein
MSESPAPEVDAMYAIGESDYKFGVGPLLVRVVDVLERVTFTDAGVTQSWWHVRAVCKPAEAHVGLGREQELYLRANALPRARRGPR